MGHHRETASVQYNLANALKGGNSRIPTEIADHNYGVDETQRPMITPTHLGDHNYIKPRSFGTLIDLQYANDICWVGGNCNHGVEFFKKNIPEYLASRNLMINLTKTEEYEIDKATDEWKKCRYLGSLLDSEEDIKRRRLLVKISYDRIRPALEDKKLDNEIKISIFNTMISSAFQPNLH